MSDRKDIELIAELVPRGSRVLDLGCGDGELLALPARARAAAPATASRSTTPTCWRASAARRQRDPAQPGRRPRPLRRRQLRLRDPLETLQHMRNTEQMLRETARVGRDRHRQLPEFRALAASPAGRGRPHAGVASRCPTSGTTRRTSASAPSPTSRCWPQGRPERSWTPSAFRTARWCAPCRTCSPAWRCSSSSAADGPRSISTESPNSWRAVAARLERRVDPRQRLVVDEGAQQLVMARAGLVRAAQERVDDPQSTSPVRAGSSPSPRRCAARPAARSVFQGARDGRAERDDAAAAPTRVAAIAATVAAGSRYGSSNGRRASSAGVAGRREAGGVGQGREVDAARARVASSRRQSRTKPAEGGSKATGSAAMRVHTSQSASGAARWAYCTGRPWRARPAQISSASPAKRISTRRGWSSGARPSRQRAERERIAGIERRRRRRDLRCACGSRRRRTRRRRSRARRRRRASGGRRAAPRSPRRSRHAAGEARGQRRRVVGDDAGRPGRSSSARSVARAMRDVAGGVDDEQTRVARAAARRAVAAFIARSSPSAAALGDRCAR